jgi:hypothetical protein
MSELANHSANSAPPRIDLEKVLSAIVSERRRFILRVLAADALFSPDGIFHCMLAEEIAPAIELFRHRLLQALREARLIRRKKLSHLLSWKHSGFHIHEGGEKPFTSPVPSPLARLHPTPGANPPAEPRSSSSSRPRLKPLTTYGPSGAISSSRSWVPIPSNVLVAKALCAPFAP